MDGRRRKRRKDEDERVEAAEQAADDAAGEAAPVPDPVAGLEAEVQDLKDRLARSFADMANMRRRQAEDMQRARDDKVLQLGAELLPVLDAFRMALRAEGSREDLQQGVDMILGMLSDLLARHGVEEVPCEGTPFDPRVHEAVSVEVRDDVEPGAIVAVQLAGYRLGDRILRPARVVVAQRPAQAGDPGEACDEERED